MQCNCLSFTFLDSWLNSLSCPNIHIWSSGHRHAVGKQGPVVLELKSSAFDPKEKVWTKFPPEGSKLTPPHNSCDFRWKDYCPQVFRLVFTPWIKIYDHYVTCSCFIMIISRPFVLNWIAGHCASCSRLMLLIICYPYVEMRLSGSFHLLVRAEAFSTSQTMIGTW